MSDAITDLPNTDEARKALMSALFVSNQVLAILVSALIARMPKQSSDSLLEMITHPETFEGSSPSFEEAVKTEVSRISGIVSQFDAAENEEDEDGDILAQYRRYVAGTSVVVTASIASILCEMPRPMTDSILAMLKASAGAATVLGDEFNAGCFEGGADRVDGARLKHLATLKFSHGGRGDLGQRRHLANPHL